MLWTLYHRAARRAAERRARRPAGGRPDRPDRLPVRGALRLRRPAPSGRRCGESLRPHGPRFLETDPGGTVVALGEGLETQFWRVDNGARTGSRVDLPEAIALREEFSATIPGRARSRARARPAWMEEVEKAARRADDRPGPADVLRSARRPPPDQSCAARFPGGALLFDASRRADRAADEDADGYQAPQWRGAGIAGRPRASARSPASPSSGGCACRRVAGSRAAPVSVLGGALLAVRLARLRRDVLRRVNVVAHRADAPVGVEAPAVRVPLPGGGRRRARRRQIAMSATTMSSPAASPRTSKAWNSISPATALKKSATPASPVARQQVRDPSRSPLLSSQCSYRTSSAIASRIAAMSPRPNAS